MINYNKKSAFTLAEVLITLGIIGVVAALTIPAVITKYEKQATVSKLKKVYTVMNNAIKMSENENGDMYTWEFPSINNYTSLITFFHKYYKPYLNVASECSIPMEIESSCFSKDKEKYDLRTLDGNNANGLAMLRYVVKLADGTYLYFLPNTVPGYIWMFVDINGQKKPNRIGRDVFVFDIYGHPYLNNPKYYKLKFWGDYLQNINVSDSVSGYSCNKNISSYSGFLCGEYIMRNGWEIPDDYPW